MQKYIDGTVLPADDDQCLEVRGWANICQEVGYKCTEKVDFQECCPDSCKEYSMFAPGVVQTEDSDRCLEIRGIENQRTCSELAPHCGAYD